MTETNCSSEIISTHVEILQCDREISHVHPYIPRIQEVSNYRYRRLSELSWLMQFDMYIDGVVGSSNRSENRCDQRIVSVDGNNGTVKYKTLFYRSSLNKDSWTTIFDSWESGGSASLRRHLNMRWSRILSKVLCLKLQDVIWDVLFSVSSTGHKNGAQKEPKHLY